ncbi:hypothetical protein FIU87_01810 [Bacillus sp. THAF10]|uniref:hypothetical protein n=1 Tax=Bacillus sp. THAF10 TaxID=2587848 RepID=UPI001268CBC2|nr:hypothetical protein [Bacillus sp. THAF10]QFT87375.1 hypothetical protein FIU87_01810 [Bacillus sp. THAF10]
MLKDMQAIIYYLTVDMRFSFKVFWSILLLSMSASFLIVLSFDTMMVFTPSLAIYIFCAITGFITTKETFPYCIKLGATRSQYTISVLTFSAMVAVVFSVMNTVIQALFKGLTTIVSADKFLTFHTVEGTTLAQTWYNQILVDSVICFLFLSIGFVIGSTFYRLGLVGGLSTLALLAILFFVPYTRAAIMDFIVNMEGVKAGVNFFAILTIALFSYLPNWGMLRNASTLPSATR